MVFTGTSNLMMSAGNPLTPAIARSTASSWGIVNVTGNKLESIDQACRETVHRGLLKGMQIHPGSQQQQLSSGHRLP